MLTRFDDVWLGCFQPPPTNGELPVFPKGPLIPRARRDVVMRTLQERDQLRMAKMSLPETP